MSLPKDPKARKNVPIFSGVLRYFPDAIAAVAECSLAGNKQHHADKPLHWDKSKSTDEADCIVRHLIESGTLDTDGIRHSAKVAWRALALLQREIEADALLASKLMDAGSEPRPGDAPFSEEELRKMLQGESKLPPPPSVPKECLKTDPGRKPRYLTPYCMPEDNKPLEKP
jgi:hypothetical protein